MKSFRAAPQVSSPRNSWHGFFFAPETGIFRALRIRDYRLFWSGNFLSNIGTWMQNVAQGWLVFELTNSPFLVGLAGFAQSVPVLIFSLVGGVIADRANRRKLLIGMQTAMMALALVLAVSITLKIVSIHEILVVALLLGTAVALHAPAYQAMVQDMVGRTDVSNAIALNSIQFNLSRVIGPTLAGWAIAGINLAACFYLNALSFLCVIFALGKLTFPSKTSRANNSSVGADLLAGFRYAWQQGTPLLLVSLVALASLFGLPYLVMMPVFARDVLHVGAQGLGYLFAAAGIGALAGGFNLARLTPGRRRGPLVVTGAVVFFAAILGFSLSKSFALSCALLLCVGWAMVSLVATVNTLLQTLVSDELRGRVLSMHTMAFFGFTPFGSLLVGALADRLGAPIAMAASSGLALILTVGLLFAAPRLLELK